MPKLVYVALETPDGVVLESFHRHDFKSYVTDSGKIYIIDGGPHSGYIRYSQNGDEKIIRKYDDLPFKELRKWIHWGKNYDKNNSRLPETKWVALCELDLGHLETLINLGLGSDFYKVMFIKELQYRMLDEEGI